MNSLSIKQLLASACIIFFALPAVAEDIETKVAVCASCHGAGGNAPIANYPKLAGQDRKYLLYTLRSYKSGARKNSIMSIQVATLTNEDLQDLATYFSDQPGDLR
ncbi:cytochrome c [Candidatus Persebacteraceae bacterium Df01]|jgi:cytochrome c553|uniref:Cytochrome c n=1 Tax=Candidatus Doriopsillibacter californiensis TaxID=2970740 RepID=A0ABT7QMY8_9GAMM|nr:cytochrome c [Candidatus Persebacteraceae bacterium Df01]